MFLLDTNVISELRRARPHGAVLNWLKKTASENLHIAAVTIGEIQSGIEITRDHDPLRAAELELWLAQVSATFNVIAMDGETFRFWAKLMHRSSNDLVNDAMLAASAKQHGLTIVTRNTKDFRVFGVDLLNPFLET